MIKAQLKDKAIGNLNYLISLVFSFPESRNQQMIPSKVRVAFLRTIYMGLKKVLQNPYVRSHKNYDKIVQIATPVIRNALKYSTTQLNPNIQVYFYDFRNDAHQALVEIQRLLEYSNVKRASVKDSVTPESLHRGWSAFYSFPYKYLTSNKFLTKDDYATALKWISQMERWLPQRQKLLLDPLPIVRSKIYDISREIRHWFSVAQKEGFPETAPRVKQDLKYSLDTIIPPNWKQGETRF